MAEMPESRPEGSGRKPREHGEGASSEAARREPVGPEAEQLMEAVVARENMFRAYEQVVSNKGAAGIDGMTVEQLKPYLQEHWAKIKEMNEAFPKSYFDRAGLVSLLDQQRKFQFST